MNYVDDEIKNRIKQLHRNNQSDRAVYAQYTASPVSARGYQLSEMYPNTVDKPDEYGISDWAADAFTEWNVNRNQVNSDAELGKYALNQAEIDRLDNAAYSINSNYSLYFDDYARVAKDLGLNDSIADSDKLLQIQSRKKELQDEQKQHVEKSNEYLENVNYWKDRHDTTDFYKSKESEEGFDLFSLDSYLYKMPGIMGSSSASLGWQALSTVSSIGAMVALASGVGAPLAVPLAGISLYGNIQSGIDENSAEVYQALKSRVSDDLKQSGDYEKLVKDGRKQLSDLIQKGRGNEIIPGLNNSEVLKNLSDDQIMDLYLNKKLSTSNVQFGKSLSDALTGTERLFANDMVATTGESVISTAVDIIPFGKLAKFTKLDKLGKLTSNAVKDSKLYNITKNRLDQIANFGISKSIQNLSKRNTARYVYDITGRNAIRAFGEGLEEGNQYLNAKAYADKEYDGKTAYALDYIGGIANYLENNIRSGVAYLAPWDTALSSDKEWLENMNSGIALGLFNIQNVAGIASRTMQYRTQNNTAKFINEAVTTDAFIDKDDLKKSIYYSANSSKLSGNAVTDFLFGREQAIKDMFDQAKSTGYAGITDEMWDEEYNRFNRIRNSKKSNLTKRLAQQRNIDVNSQDYDIFVGMTDYYMQRMQEVAKNHKNVDDDWNKLVNDNKQQILDDIKKQYPEGVQTLNPETEFQLVTLNAMLKAYDAVEKELSGNSTLLDKLSKLYGIKYNNKDLRKFKKIFDRQNKQFRETIVKNLNDNPLQFTNEKGEQFEYTYTLDDLDQFDVAQQNDLVEAYKKIIYANLDYTRAKEDIDAFSLNLDHPAIKNDKKLINKIKNSSSSKIDSYKKSIEDNRQFEQQISDSNKHEEEVKPIQQDTSIKPASKKEEEIKPTANVQNVPESNKQVEIDNKQNTDTAVQPTQIASGKVEAVATEKPVTTETTQQTVPQTQQQVSDTETVQKPQQTVEPTVQQTQQPVQETKQEPKSEKKETKSSSSVKHTLVTDSEYENLKKRMRQKLNNLNVGFDPEILEIGTKMAIYHIEGGTRKFIQYAKAMIDDLGDQIKPYLKSFYNAARDLPGMEELSKEMDSYDYVSKIDLNNLDAVESQDNYVNNEFGTFTEPERSIMDEDNNVPEPEWVKVDKNKIDQKKKDIVEQYNQALNFASTQINDAISVIMNWYSDLTEGKLVGESFRWRYYDNQGNLKQRSRYFVDQDIRFLHNVQDTLSRNVPTYDSFARTSEQELSLQNEYQNNLLNAQLISQIYQNVDSALMDLVNDYYSVLEELDYLESNDQIPIRVAEERKNYLIGNLKLSVQAYYDKYLKDQQKQQTPKKTSYRLHANGTSVENIQLFQEMSTEPGFITDSTFEFEEDNVGNVWIKITNNGRTVYTRMAYDSNDQALYNKMREFIRQVKQNPGKYEIVPVGLARTNGKFVNSENAVNLTESPFWHYTKDPYQMQDSQIKIGVSNGNFGGTISRVSEVMGFAPSLGQPFFRVTIKKNEDTDRTSEALIRLVPRFIKNTPGAAEAIVNILMQYNQDYYTTSDGIKTPFNPARLLNFIIHNGPETGESVAAQGNEELQRRLANHRLFLNSNGILFIADKQFDIQKVRDDANVRKQLIDTLNSDQYNFHFNIQQEYLQGYFGKDADNSNSFLNGLKNWFKLQDNVNKITIIPGVMEFDKKMLGIQGDPKGISALGYYVSNGLLLTDVVGIKDALLFIKDVKLQEKVQEDQTEKIEENIQTDESADSIDDLELFPDELPLNFAKPVTSDERIDIDNAVKIVQRLTGLSEDQVEVSKDILGISKDGFYILGQARLDSIALSEMAPKGVEYHEVWHRIANLLMEERTRDKVYSQVRKKYGSNLTDIEVDEILADRFMEFMLDSADVIDYTTTNLFKRIWNFIKVLAKTSNLTLAKIYYKINTGGYAKVIPSNKNIERYKSLINSGAQYNFEYRGSEFKEFVNVPQLSSAIDSLMCVLFDNPKYRIDDYKDAENINIDFLKTLLAKSKRNTMQELFQNWDVVEQEIRNRLRKLNIKLFTQQYDEAVEQADSSDIGKIDMDDYTKSSYEFDAFGNQSAEVKFFFTTIPQYVLNEKTNKLELVKDASTGLYKFYNPRYVWNVVINDLHSSSTVNQLYENMKDDPMYAAIRYKLDKLVQKTKSSDKKEAVDAEAMLTKILTAIHSNRNTFLTVLAGHNAETLRTLRVVDNTIDYKTRMIPHQWSSQLAMQENIFYTDESGVIKFTEPSQNSKGGRYLLQSVLQQYNKIRTALISGKDVKIGNEVIDLHTKANQQRLKRYMSRLLGMVGIDVDPNVFSMMQSLPKYEGLDTYESLKNIFAANTSDYGGFVQIFNVLENVLASNSIDVTTVKVNDIDIPLNQLYNNVGYVKQLAIYQQMYNNTHDTLMMIGAGNNLLYASSQNCYITDVVDRLNQDSDYVQQMKDTPYNNNSVILQQVQTGAKVSAEIFQNFKTDNRGDLGSDYHGINDLEDYVSKMTLTLSGKLIFPTIEAKKTYYVLDGIKLPKGHIKNVFIGIDGKPQFIFDDNVASQFILYAKDELNRIKQCMRQLDDTIENNPDYIPEEQRIKNYHTNNSYKDKDGKKVKVEPNGTRFIWFTGVYVIEDGKYKFVSFNDPKLSSKECLKIAEDNFFNQPYEVQLSMINSLLSNALNNELQYCNDIGLINFDSISDISSYNNVLLDDTQISNRMTYYQGNNTLSDFKYNLSIIDVIAENMTSQIMAITETEKVFSGDPAYFKVAYDEYGIIDSSIDKIKRAGGLISTGTNNRLDLNDFDVEYTCAELNDYEVKDAQYDDVILPLFKNSSVYETFKREKGTSVIYNEDGTLKPIEELKKEDEALYDRAIKEGEQAAKGYSKGINVADAAVYVTPEMYARLMRANGQWSYEIQQAYEILQDPNSDWTGKKEAYDKVMKGSVQVLKYMAYGMRMENGLSIPYFNKMALFPLFKEIATGDIKLLYDRMIREDDKIDMVMFNSAVKVGSQSATDWDNGNGVEKLVKYKQDIRYLRQQLNTDEHTHELIMTGTQMAKSALSNIDLNARYGFGDDTITGQEVKERIFSCMNELSNRGAMRITNQFTENGRFSQKKFSEYLIQYFQDQDSNINMLDSAQLSDGKLNVNLSAVSESSLIESVIISKINAETIDINLPGGAYIQRSTFGLNGTKPEVMSDKMLNNGQRLKLIDEKDGSMQSIITISAFRHIIPNYDNLTFEEAREWLLKHNVIGENSGPFAIGYRIPTQAQASISPLKIMDVLSANMKDTTVLPEAFTKLTGSDFDIDKLFMIHYATDKNGKKIEYDESKPIEEQSEDAIKNRLIDTWMKVLITPWITIQSKGSIDNATDTLKGVLKAIDKNSKTSRPYTFIGYTPSFQESKKSEYTIGKAGIGPFALNNAHHVLTQLVNPKFKEDSFTLAFDLVNTNKVYDDDGSGMKILDWLSALINGFVDIAKDPFVVKLNVNAYTYNMTSFLIRMGKGESSFYFLRQPLIVDLAQAILKVRGKYGKDETKTQSQIEKEITQQILDKYGIEESLVKDRMRTLDSEESWELYSNFFEKCKESLSNPDFDTYNFQETVYLMWLKLKPYTNDLANLVNYSKIDTKKMGKSFAEQVVFETGMNQLSENSNFQYGEVNRFFDETFIRVKFNNSVLLGRNLFRNQILGNTDSFIYVMNNVLFRMGKLKGIKQDTLKRVTQSIESGVKSKFFSEKIHQNGKTVKSLFYGNNSVPRQLIRLKRDIKLGKYPSLLDAEGKCNNALLNYLYPSTVKMQEGFIEPDYIFTRIISNDVSLQNDLIVSWEQLLQDPDERIRNFAEELIHYAFFASGDRSGVNAFFKYVPASWRKSSGYSQYMDNITYNNSSIDFTNADDVFLNNWQNPDFVPTAKLTTQILVIGEDGNQEISNASYNGIYSDKTLPGTDVRPFLIFDGFFNKELQIKPVSYVSKTEFNEDLQMEYTRSYPVFTPFVKLRFGRTGTMLDYAVYKCVGYKTVKTKSGLSFHPIYMLVNKKGFSYSGQQITEYGRTDQYSFNMLNSDITENDLFNGNIEKYISTLPKNVQNEYMQLLKGIRSLNSLESYKGVATRFNEVYDTQDVVGAKELETEAFDFDSNPVDETEQFKDVKQYSVQVRGKDKPYTKYEPSLPENINKAFVFTENAQAYTATHPYMESNDPILSSATPQTVKLNVSDMSNTDTPNTAGIRSLDGVTQQPNVFGVVVKKYQQLGGINSKFESSKGLFKDTDKDFELFKQYNLDFLKQIQDSDYSEVVLPQSIAMGRAALPKRFAEWLQELLNVAFNVEYKLRERTNGNYVGFGLELEDNYNKHSKAENTGESTQNFINPIDKLAYEWTRKEGWSINYFRQKVLPKINTAWQLEFKLADDQSINPDLSGTMNFNYNGNKLETVTADSTIEAIKRGERTATTRYEEDGHIDYWKNVKVGDVINFYKKDSTGKIIDSVKVIVTKPLTKLVNSKQNPKEFTLHSGGAYGADTEFNLLARQYGMTLMNYRDSGNINMSKRLRDLGVLPIILGDDDMSLARNEIRKLLNESYNNDIQGNLKTRNYYQVANSNSVIAIGTLTNSKNDVTGGTSVAVRLGIAMNKPTYVWDLNTEMWYKYNIDSKLFEPSATPTLTKNFAGVGTRDIEDYQVKNKATGKFESRKEYVGNDKASKAIQAIRDVFEKTFNPNYRESNGDLFSVNNDFKEQINNRLISELRELGISEDEINSVVNDFNENYLSTAKTQDQAENMLRKFLCNK